MQRFSQVAELMLRAAASPVKQEREMAQRAIAAELDWPLRQGIFDKDNLGGIFERQLLARGAQAEYPFDFIEPGTEDDYVAYTLPRQGRLPERHVESDQVFVPTFRVGNSINFDIRFAEQARFDVILRAIRVYEAGYVRKNNSDGWRVILTAADGRGTVVTSRGGAPLTGADTVPTAAAGQFTKELVSRMRTAMTRGAGGNGNAGRLTDLYISLEGMEDILAWDASDIDDFTRRQIFVSEEYGLAQVYGVTLHAMTEFGRGQEYENFLVSVLGRAHQTTPINFEEYCIGLDLSTMDSFVQPVRKELETLEDPDLYRQQEIGFYGWMEHGFACLDNRRVIIGEY